MTVSSTTVRLTWLGDGVTVNFPITFSFYLASDIEVILAGSVIVTGYTVTGGGTGTPPVPGTGTLVMGVAPASGAILQAILNVPQTQTVNLVDGTAFQSAVLNQVNDRATMMSLRLQDQILRAIRAPDGDLSPAMLLPAATARANTVLGFDVNGNAIAAQTLPSGSLSRSSVGNLLYPITAAETATGVAITDYGSAPGNVLRYGLVANSVNAAGNNTTILQTLLNPSITAGLTGPITFPNSTGADIYYLSGMISIRDGCRLDLQQCTLNFSKTYASGDNFAGFLMFIRDVEVANGTITVNYNASGNDAGYVMRIGSRSGYAYGPYTGGIFDLDTLVSQGLPPMGNIRLRNLRINSNNAGAIHGGPMVLMLGGIQGFLAENIIMNGQNAAQLGLYYEFGFASTNGQPLTQNQWSSSHANELTFRNIYITNLSTVFSGNVGIQITGAYNVTIENLYVNGGAGAIGATPGEALFYRPWPSVDDIGAKRNITVRNVVGEALTGDGIIINGAPGNSGYLSGLTLTPAQLTDLYQFSIDGFAIQATGRGVHVLCSGTLRNGVINGTGSSGQLCVSEEVMRLVVDNVQIMNGSSFGIRMGTGENIYSPQRLRFGSISNCRICGNTIGVYVAWGRGISVRNCQIGYNTLYDGQSETTQTTGIYVDGTNSGGGVYAENNFVSTGGGTAYGGIGSAPSCWSNVVYPRGETGITTTLWDINGQNQVTSTNLASKAALVNTVDKYAGRQAYNTSTNKLFVAQGSATTSTWISVDGATTVTPS